MGFAVWIHQAGCSSSSKKRAHTHTLLPISADNHSNQSSRAYGTQLYSNIDQSHKGPAGSCCGFDHIVGLQINGQVLTDSRQQTPNDLVYEVKWSSSMQNSWFARPKAGLRHGPQTSDRMTVCLNHAPPRPPSSPGNMHCLVPLRTDAKKYENLFRAHIPPMSLRTHPSCERAVS